MAESYKKILQVHTFLFWLVNLVIEVALNTLDNIFDIFVGDITIYFESIPVEGEDNLLEVIVHIVRIDFK